MIAKIDDNIQDAFNQLKDHHLVKVEDTDQVKIFALVKDIEKPDQWYLSTRAIFHKGLIAITGDYRPGNTAATCCFGYGLDWFMSHDHHWQYLASKFLQQSWQPDVLQEKLIAYADQIEHDAQHDLDQARLDLPSVDATFDLAEYDRLILEAARLRKVEQSERKTAIFPQIVQRAGNGAIKLELQALDYLADRVTDQDGYDDFDHDEYAAIVAVIHERRSDAAKLREVAADHVALSNWGDFENALHAADLDTLLVDTDMISMGHDYCPAAIMWLCGIQRAFAAKYAELEAGG